MVVPRKIYDFCDPENGSAAPPRGQQRHPPVENKVDDTVDSGGDYRRDFFIDGWDAYERWLDDVRDRMDGGND